MKQKLILATTAALCVLTQPAFAEQAVPSTKAGLFAKTDTNGNGKISKEEWLAYSTKPFEEICKDGDDEITPSEWDEYQAKETNAH